MSKTVYRCENQACTLGTRETPGMFTGGISAEQVTLLTGKPLEHLEKDKDFGEGFCPNCGERGKEFDDEARKAEVLKAAKAAYDAQVAAIKEGAV